MKISMWNIFDSLPYTEVIPLIQEGACEISRVRLLTSDVRDDDTVFVGVESELATDTFIVFRRDIIIVKDAEPSGVFNQVCEISERFGEWDMELSRCMTDEDGIRKMLDISGDMLMAPAMVYDSDGHALALTPGYPGSISPVWADILRYEGLTEENMRELADNIELSRVFKDEQSTYHDTGNPLYPNFMHCSLRLRRRIVAHLVIFEFAGTLGRGIGTVSDNLMEKISTYIELHEDRFGEHARIQHELAGLLEGRIGPDSADWAKCISVLRWRDDGAHDYQIIVMSEDVDQETVLLSKAYTQLAAIQSDVAVARVENHIAILQRVPRHITDEGSGDDSAQDTMESLRGPLHDDRSLWHMCANYLHRGFVMGASAPFSRLDDIMLYHDQARCEARRCLQDKVMFSSAQHNAGNHFVELLEGDPLAIAYADRQVKVVYDFDDEHGTSYFDTLRTYLLCGCQLSRAAKHLHIHRNSLAYRLGRIEEIAGPLESFDLFSSQTDTSWASKAITFVLLSATRR